MGEEKTEHNHRCRSFFGAHTIKVIELFLAPYSFKVDRFEGILNGVNFLFHYFGGIFDLLFLVLLRPAHNSNGHKTRAIPGLALANSKVNIYFKQWQCWDLTFQLR